MKFALILALGIATLGVSDASAQPAHSPYVGQELREIKALAPDYIEGLKAGAGLGFAKAAELNGYPGPAHLLELADQIPLDAVQVAAVTVLQDKMRVASIEHGAKLLAAEANLEQAFREKHIDHSMLSAMTLEAGTARARLRAEHLSAHIEATALLRPEQVHRYQVLRGYTGGLTVGRPHRKHVH